MRILKEVLVVGVMFCFLFIIAIRMSFGSTVGWEYEVTSISLSTQKISQISLTNKEVYLTNSTIEPQVVEVSLIMANYKCEYQKGNNDQANKKERSFWCYELKSTNETLHYSRYIWDNFPGKSFRLFANINGKNYLAWVYTCAVCIEDVSESNNKTNALEGFLSKTDRYIVPIPDLADREAFIWRDEVHLDIDIISVDTDEKGSLHLVVQSPKTKKRYEFVFDGKSWQSVELSKGPE